MKPCENCHDADAVVYDMPSERCLLRIGKWEFLVRWPGQDTADLCQECMNDKHWNSQAGASQAAYDAGWNDAADRFSS